MFTLANKMILIKSQTFKYTYTMPEIYPRLPSLVNILKILKEPQTKQNEKTNQTTTTSTTTAPPLPPPPQKKKKKKKKSKTKQQNNKNNPTPNKHSIQVHTN